MICRRRGGILMMIVRVVMAVLRRVWNAGRAGSTLGTAAIFKCHCAVYVVCFFSSSN